MYRTCRLWIAAAVFLFLHLPLMAQAVSGTILGSVQDSSGAAVPGTSVTIVNIETGQTRSVVTDSSGEYTVPSLPPGMYSASAQMKGFKKVSLSGIRLNVDQKARVDLQLEVGEVTESIQVQGAVALVAVRQFGTGRHRERVADQGTAAERPRLCATDTPHSGRHAWCSGFEQRRGEQRGLAHVLNHRRQRHADPRQQLSAGRHRQ